ncbi:MAG: NAD(+) synthase [Desulfobacteraceae bacterium 4572_87]|nr:MAG: NAD(+) synthase [Desulfobacteraceae bacterium 4572_87]
MGDVKKTANLERTLGLAHRASDHHAALVLFPELGLSAFSNEDLFHQDALLEAVLAALEKLINESRNLSPVLLVGAPLRFQGKLFNCALVIHRGKVLGIVPKTYLPNYREYYEKRQFVSARHALERAVRFQGQSVPFGNDLIFEAMNFPGFALHVEICEDMWVPIPPSAYAALAGAAVLANLSASNITVGKTDYRRLMCASQSAKCLSAYLYSAAGYGESTTDMAWDGYAMVYENNVLLAETERFQNEEQIIFADIDLERLLQERMRTTSFQDSVADHREHLSAMRRIPFEFKVPENVVSLMREVSRFPYVPWESTARDDRCYEVYNIQVHGLMKRMSTAGVKKLVIGVSGGLDSTQALIVAARTMDRLGFPRSHILGFTMPGFATSETTRNNALALMDALGITAREMDIRPACLQVFKDIDHPFAHGEKIYDVTFENVQAGQRTAHLFRLANFHNAIVLGTGDLSELALGWSTYGVGDQMSHYNVNGSVPKTLIHHLIRWVVKTGQFNRETAAVLEAIAGTEISPELVPDENGHHAKPSQKTESTIGPYELQDFNLYYITRFGFRPSKVAFLSHYAWSDKDRGIWPGILPPEQRHQYDLATIKQWLEVFLYRFFKTSQFKRSALPNGPKVGSGGSLSPRGDWRAPSDSEAVVWLDELRQNVPD